MDNERRRELARRMARARGPARGEHRMSEKESLVDARAEFFLRNDATGEIYSLGPMYSGTDEYVYRKVTNERLPYSWTLLKVVGRVARV